MVSSCIRKQFFRYQEQNVLPVRYGRDTVSKRRVYTEAVLGSATINYGDNT